MIPLRRRQHGQPAVARPAQRWLDRGLVYADLLTTYPANAITGQADTITGTKVTTTPWGLARGFGTTVGVASTDRVLTTLSDHPLQRTWIIRSIRTGSGGGGLGRYFDVSSAVFLLDDNTTSRYQFGRGATGSSGFWQIARQGNGVPGVVAVSYDETTGLSAVPTMYLDGIKKTLITSTQPVGTLTAKTGGYYVGNSSATNRNYNGSLSDFLVFDSILTDGEIAELADPSRVLADRTIWVPVSLASSNVTITGTPGNAVAAGVAARVNQARSVTGTTGSAAAAGVTAKINQARTVTGAVGNAVAAGVTATVNRATSIAATPGNAVAAGVHATITAAGAVVITGAPGNAAAAGVSASINQARSVTGTAGNAVATGVQATISTAGAGVTITATPGNAFASGPQAIIVRNVAIAAAVGNAVAAGRQATVSNITATDDLYPLEGMSQDYPLQGMTQTYPLAGQTPS